MQFYATKTNNDFSRKKRPKSIMLNGYFRINKVKI